MDTIGSVASAITPVATLIGAVAPAAMSLMKKTPKAPNIKVPTAAQTPTMPTPDDAAARAAALKEIATRASQHGRQSTNLYDKKETLGA